MNTLTVANTILEQLGGNAFRAMTGARQFVGTPDSLMFRLPTGFAKDRINSVAIRLDPSDTYTVMFNTRRGVDVIQRAQAHGVYAEDLRRVFTDATGLDTGLGRPAAESREPRPVADARALGAHAADEATLALLHERLKGGEVLVGVCRGRTSQFYACLPHAYKALKLQAAADGTMSAVIRYSH